MSTRGFIRLNTPADYEQMIKEGPPYVFLAITKDGCPACGEFRKIHLPFLAATWNGGVYDFPTTLYHGLPSPKEDFELRTILFVPAALILARNRIDKRYHELKRIAPNSLSPIELTQYLERYSRGNNQLSSAQLTDYWEKFQNKNRYTFLHFLRDFFGFH